MPSQVLSGGDAFEKKMAELADQLGTGSVSVGFLEGAVYPDGTPVAAVAFWNEFGAPSKGQPPRPFFRQMIEAESSTWPDKLAALLAGGHDVEDSLALLGEDIEGALKQSIMSLSSPPLAQSTIDAKGFEKPLIDTGQMKDSVGYEVTK